MAAGQRLDHPAADSGRSFTRSPPRPRSHAPRVVQPGRKSPRNKKSATCRAFRPSISLTVRTQTSGEDLLPAASAGGIALPVNLMLTLDRHRRASNCSSRSIASARCGLARRVCGERFGADPPSVPWLASLSSSPSGRFDATRSTDAARASKFGNGRTGAYVPGRSDGPCGSYRQRSSNRPHSRCRPRSSNRPCSADRPHGTFRPRSSQGRG